MGWNKPKPELERFWEKVNKTDPSGCWVWTAGKDDCGYGNFQAFGKTVKAHRFSYELHHGPIPKNIEVRHTCHRPFCVRPDHLQLGTHADNMRDLAISGRRKGIRYKPKAETIKPKIKTTEDRFWEKVDKSGPISTDGTPCWVWKATKNKQGYGHFWPKKKGKVMAHRFSYEMAHGTIPEGLDILHSCDNPPCVNPIHLRAGTHTDNMRDMEAKGRRIPATGPRHGSKTKPRLNKRA